MALAAALVCIVALAAGLMVSVGSLMQVREQAAVGETPTAVAAVLRATPPQSAVEPQTSFSGVGALPADVPIPRSVDPQSFVGAQDAYSFITDLSYSEVVEFYRVQLPEQGWTKIDYGTRVGRAGAELRFRKADRVITIRIADVAYVGRLVEISLTA